jgi:hypothetical protein
MKTFTLLAATSAAALLTSAAIAQAQDFTPPGATPPVAGATAPASVAGNGDWTLRQREKWLDDRINATPTTWMGVKPTGRIMSWIASAMTRITCAIATMVN